MSEFDKLISALEFTTIYTKADMLRAFELGQKVKLEQIQEKVVGMSVNGKIEGVVNEKDLV